MPTQLYNMMNPNPSNQGNFIQRFIQFKQNFNGDAQQQIQQALNSGKITQQQYNNAVRQAQQIMNNGQMMQSIRSMLGF